MNDETKTEEEELTEEAEQSESEAVDTQAEETEPSAESPASAVLRLIRSGQESGDTYPINGHAVIGRFDSAVGPVDIDLAPLPEAVYISRKHAKIEFADGAWTITDLGSSNGTFVLVPGEDFQRIEQPTLLEDGAQIALGNARFSFHFPSHNSQEEASVE
ncbi:MAG: FHA domain-containing protein [Fimbriimonadales bacterium]|nr:FHA domain-containing protein [Fimbriimonadales bacterium]